MLTGRIHHDVIGHAGQGLVLAGGELHRADEAGGIAGGKQLFGIVAGAVAAQFLGRGRVTSAVVDAVFGNRGAAIAATGGLGMGGVKRLVDMGMSFLGLISKTI
jgi:hypothetical protein